MKNTSKLSEELGIYKILDSSSDEEKDKENNETTVDKINFYSAFIYTPPDKAPVGVYQMGVAGNNGSVSCDTYCAGTGGKSWNDELPISWKGAKCVGTLPVETGCANTFSEKNPTQCICEATFTKWN